MSADFTQDSFVADWGFLSARYPEKLPLYDGKRPLFAIRGVLLRIGQPMKPPERFCGLDVAFTLSIPFWQLWELLRE